MDAMPHMTCRDRNLNATQALLLGLCAEGVNKVLVVTGDPIPAANRDEVKSVYNFNSRKLIKYVDGLNKTILPTPFRIFAALNVNVRNFGVELELARQKEQSGALAFLTQPILSPEALKNLQTARETLQGKILGGIMPVISERNARFMNSEIAGITVDEKIIELYRARHPLLDKKTVVPVSITLGRDYRMVVITGPNTGGKTVTLKTVGLLSIMGMSGLHIPASDGSELSLFREIFGWEASIW